MKTFLKVLSLGLSVLIISIIISYFLGLQEGFQNRASSYQNDACRVLETQQSCLKYKYCGWCPDQNRCIEWLVRDGSVQPRDRIYRDVAQKCSLSQFQRAPETASEEPISARAAAEIEPVKVCTKQTSQSSCIKYSDCAWCPDQNRCIDLGDMYSSAVRGDPSTACDPRKLVLPVKGATQNAPIEQQAGATQELPRLRGELDKQRAKLKQLNSLINYTNSEIARLKQRIATTKLTQRGQRVARELQASNEATLKRQMQDRKDTQAKIQELETRLKTFGKTA